MAGNRQRINGVYLRKSTMVGRRLVYLFFIVFFFVFFSCVKEFSFENGLVSAGVLKKDAGGNCLPIQVAGTYISGRQLGDTNFIQIGVNVISRGRYMISTDTVNGYSFQASGNFSDSGYFLIKLSGSGKPLASDTDNFTIFYDSSICQFSVNVQSGSPNSKPAAYTLQGSPNSCMNDTLLGGYIKGVTLDTSNRINIRLNVTSPGTYNISTDTINGYYFSGSGVIGSTGVTTVTLAGAGTPQNQELDNFQVTAGLSVCSFPVTVLQVIGTTNTDHFPLTANSHWNYDVSPQGDTLSRRLTDTATISGNLYSIMQENESSNTPAQYFFRKQGNNYYEYAQVDKYTNSVGFNPQVFADIQFLQEGLVSGSNWFSDEYSGTIQGGQTILLRYVFSCADANASVVINGKAFSNVYKIIMKPQVRSLGGSYDPTDEQYNLYYAKGVGLIFDQKVAQGYSQSLFQIRNWLVN
jgi:hypothetical protein